MGDIHKNFKDSRPYTVDMSIAQHFCCGLYEKHLGDNLEDAYTLI